MGTLINRFHNNSLSNRPYSRIQAFRSLSNRPPSNLFMGNPSCPGSLSQRLLHPYNSPQFRDLLHRNLPQLPRLLQRHLHQLLRPHQHQPRRWGISPRQPP